MAPPVASFVVFAEMRTGSNQLEETLNTLPGVACHGEAFNPHFVGHQGRETLFGIDKAARDADPLALWAKMREETAGLAGFRFFHDHDRRVLDAVLADPTCAKVILTRDPAEAYVSQKIAEATGQWRITSTADRKVAKVRFDAEEYLERTERLSRFRAGLRRRLQAEGQAAFELDYRELLDETVLSGLARYLGRGDVRLRPSARLKRQNPAPLRDKVENPGEMEAVLATMGLAAPAMEGTTPPVERLRATARPPLLCLPIPGVAPDGLGTALAAAEIEPDPFTVESLRQWLNRTKRRRQVTVVCHPLLRAWRLAKAAAGGRAPDRAALLGHLEARRGTGLPPEEAPQAAWIARFAGEVAFDAILREEALAEGLRSVGLSPLSEVDARDRAAVDAAADEDVEAAVRGFYNVDYRLFGYRKWARER